MERARDTYSFSHLTLQEYLTAKYIVDNQQVDWLVENHLTDERWREVFLLVAGLVKGRTGADTLLIKMEQQAQIYVTKSKLKELLQWADEATIGSKNLAQPAVKRAAAMSFTLALARNIIFNLVLTRATDIDSDIDQAEIEFNYLSDFISNLNSAFSNKIDFNRVLDSNTPDRFRRLSPRNQAAFGN